MTIQEITKRIEAIKASAGDDEAAHSMEDDLRKDFIAYLARGGKKDIQAKAALVQTTDDLSFARWCA